MSEPDIQRYLDGIESQHQSRPKFMTLLTKTLEKVDSAHGIAKDLPYYFYVQNAVGVQLDVVGALVGVDRRFPPVSIPGQPDYLTDDLYRVAILARIIQNQWDGTGGAFRDIWDATMANLMDARYYDNQDMTMDVFINGGVAPIMVELILRGYIFPKPMGVGMNVNIIDVVNEKTSWAQCVASLDDARQLCPMNYFPQRDTRDSGRAGACAEAGSGYVLCLMEYHEYDSTTDSGRSGASCYAGSGWALARIYVGTDQPDTSAIRNNAIGLSNSARIALTTI